MADSKHVVALFLTPQDHKSTMPNAQIPPEQPCLNDTFNPADKFPESLCREFTHLLKLLRRTVCLEP